MNIEIFSCSGGMAEGFRRAGIRFDFVFDKDPNACDSYEANLGHLPIQMNVRDLVRMVSGGWRPGTVDLLVADPPCTPWSRAGKRDGLADERDMLRETADLIALLRPRAYLIGNVPGLQDSSSWHVVQEVIGGLAKHGYCVADYAQLDAANYGVPQHRVRPFWFGHMDGPCIRWPAPTHGAPAQPTLPGVDALAPWVTCREALGHLPAEQLGRPVRLRWRTSCHPPSPMSGNGGGVIVFNGAHPPADPDRPAPTLGAKDRGQGTVLATRVVDPNRPPAAAATPHRAITGARDQALMAWPWDRPSTTVCAGEVLAPAGRSGRSGESQRGNPNAIVLSEHAAAILQGFPETWGFLGKTKKSRWSQIGQAMPPALAHAVARSVAAQRTAAREVAA